MSYILAALLSAALLAADQITKYFITANFVLGQSKPFLPGILEFTYIHNNGGAWGLMEGHTWLLLTVTLLIMIICIALLIKKGLKNKLLFWAICLILSGGLGNMADRLFRGGEVVDFLHLQFMPKFPVFNVADCAVCVGAALLLVYFVGDMIHDARLAKKSEEQPVEDSPLPKGR